MYDFDVKVVFKKVKYMNIRIKPTLEVILTAPLKTKQKWIDVFFSDRKAWIERKLKWFKENGKVKTQPVYIEGEIFMFLGREYKLRILESDNDCVLIEDDFLSVYSSRYSDKNFVRALIDGWYFKQAEVIFNDLIVKWSDITGLYPFRVRVKSMKSRWGSCNFVKRYINLNVELVKKDMEFVDYVVLHEVGHLRFSHHQRDFYDFIGLYIPNWKEIRKRNR